MWFETRDFSLLVDAHEPLFVLLFFIVLLFQIIVIASLLPNSAVINGEKTDRDSYQSLYIVVTSFQLKPQSKCIMDA